MSFIDKAKNTAEDALGKAKEVVGDITDNKDLEAEGKGDQGSASIKKFSPSNGPPAAPPTSTTQSASG